MPQLGRTKLRQSLCRGRFLRSLDMNRGRKKLDKALVWITFLASYVLVWVLIFGSLPQRGTADEQISKEQIVALAAGGEQ